MRTDARCEQLFRGVTTIEWSDGTITTSIAGPYDAARTAKNVASRSKKEPGTESRRYDRSTIPARIVVDKTVVRCTVAVEVCDMQWRPVA